MSRFSAPTPTSIPLAPVHRSDVSAGIFKQFEVAADEVWQILWGYVRLTTSSSGGNREVRLEITNTDGPLWRTQAVDTQGSSLVGDYHFSSSTSEPIATKVGQHYLPLPAMCLLKGGDTVAVHEVNEVDAAGDVLAVEFVLQEHRR
ncbi:MAG TPA: hypothetical protein VIG24_05930 [Acidimicrobiia bacterium]